MAKANVYKVKTARGAADATTVRVRVKKTEAAVKRDINASAAKRRSSTEETVTQGKSSGGFVVFTSPIKPRHVSPDLIFAAVRSLKAR